MDRSRSLGLFSLQGIRQQIRRLKGVPSTNRKFLPIFKLIYFKRV